MGITVFPLFFRSFSGLVRNISFYLKNSEEYLKFFEWTKDYVDNREELSEPYRPQIWAKLCESLHDPSFNKVYPSIGDWWVNRKCDENFVMNLIDRHRRG